MTRTYAAKRLLEHGPLTMREFREITGWPTKQAMHVLWALTRRREVLRLGGGSVYRYRLAA